jgi:hypothetical protein
VHICARPETNKIDHAKLPKLGNLCNLPFYCGLAIEPTAPATRKDKIYSEIN